MDVQDQRIIEHFNINYGPWDRLEDNTPFVEEVGPKPAGANFYPSDMTKEEFEAAELSDKASLYTFLRRNEDGSLKTVPYREMFPEQVQRAADLLEEGKADILGLYMIQQLHAKGEVEGDLKDYYVTFMAGIFRSVRFDASSVHGKANMIRFNFFQDYGAFERSEADGTYRVNFDKLEEAMVALSETILTLQGDGNYQGVSQLVEEKAMIGPQLQSDLDRLASVNIPVDIVFEQGVDVLGL